MLKSSAGRCASPKMKERRETEERDEIEERKREREKREKGEVREIQFALLARFPANWSESGAANPVAANPGRPNRPQIVVPRIAEGVEGV